MYSTLLLLLPLALAQRPKAPAAFSVPESEEFDHVNPLIGNGGDTPNGSGGMIPSTAPPFAMTRWVAQTHQNYVSVTPYNYTATTIHGFQGTRQPAIWMGESAPVVVVPGVVAEGGQVKSVFEERGMVFDKSTEVITPSYYSVELDNGAGGQIFAEQSATSRTAHLRFTFTGSSDHTPYILVESSRPSVITSTPTNITYPDGTTQILPKTQEICGSSSERQDWIITPISIAEKARGFKGYFCARFDAPFGEWGVVQNRTLFKGQLEGEGTLLSAYATFPDQETVTVRMGTSFISIEQARKNLDAEIPDGSALEETAKSVREAWVEKLGRVQVEGGTTEEREVFWTAIFHALQYPNEQSEQGRYYSGYDDQVHKGDSYTGYSIWDTYRAEWTWLILFAPERVPGMITSMLNDYIEGGWLPMWKNIVETNIMVATHADSLIAEAVLKGITGFDLDLAWEAVWKDASMPPEKDEEVEYADRQENVDYEVRAGLVSVYDEKWWVADDIHSESASRTLDYAYDDYAAAQLAQHMGKQKLIVSMLMKRAMNAPFTIFNDETGFMEAKNASGAWAGEDRGWTEGDKWAYSFDVVHDIPGLIEKRGGNASFVKSLDEHFDGGHNDHTNEPSHHIPYLYAMAGAAYKTQERVREIARENYNNTPRGLSGNEDCGQMSAWYIFSAMGFYPVNPVSGDYIVGSPFFDKITIDLPSGPHDSAASDKKRTLTIISKDAGTKPYVKSLTINGVKVTRPIVTHQQIKDGGEVVFEMSNTVEQWGNENIDEEMFDVDVHKTQVGVSERSHVEL